MTTTTDDDPRIGSVDIDTWRAMPDPGNPAGNRTGAWVVLAGDDPGEPDVWIGVADAEFPEDVAKFIVEAVTNEYARQADSKPTTSAPAGAGPEKGNH